MGKDQEPASGFGNNPQETGGLSRRDFLKLAGAVSATMVLSNRRWGSAEASVSGLYGDLEIPEAQLTLQKGGNPQNVQAFTARVLPDGTEERFVAVNNSFGGLKKYFLNTTIYLARLTPGKDWTQYYPILQAPGKVVNAILASPDRPDELILAGDIGRGIQVPFVSPVSISSRNPTKLTLPEGISGEITDLFQTRDGDVIANGRGIGDTAARVRIFRDPVSGFLSNAQAITDSNGGYLRPSGAPVAIAGLDQDTFQDIGLGQKGIVVTTTNLTNNTGSREPFFERELGSLDNWTKGKDCLVVNNSTYQFRAVLEVDPEGRPNKIKYVQPYRRWLDGAGIPGYQPGSLVLGRHLVGVDGQGLAHNWFLMGMVINDDWKMGIGHLPEGADPDTDKNALSWRYIGPAGLRVGFFLEGSIQRGMVFCSFQGQKGLEFPVYNHAQPSEFGGMVFWPVDSNYSPLDSAREVYIDKGLNDSLLPPVMQPRAYLSALFKNFSPGW